MNRRTLIQTAGLVPIVALSSDEVARAIYSPPPLPRRIAWSVGDVAWMYAEGWETPAAFLIEGASENNDGGDYDCFFGRPIAMDGVAPPGTSTGTRDLYRRFLHRTAIEAVARNLATCESWLSKLQRQMIEFA